MDKLIVHPSYQGNFILVIPAEPIAKKPTWIKDQFLKEIVKCVKVRLYCTMTEPGLQNSDLPPDGAKRYENPGLFPAILWRTKSFTAQIV